MQTFPETLSLPVRLVGDESSEELVKKLAAVHNYFLSKINELNQRSTDIEAPESTVGEHTHAVNDIVANTKIFNQNNTARVDTEETLFEDKIRLYTNSTQRMIVDENGNIGMGITPTTSFILYVSSTDTADTAAIQGLLVKTTNVDGAAVRGSFSNSSATVTTGKGVEGISNVTVSTTGESVGVMGIGQGTNNLVGVKGEPSLPSGASGTGKGVRGSVLISIGNLSTDVRGVSGEMNNLHKVDNGVHTGTVGIAISSDNGKTGTKNVGIYGEASNADTNLAGEFAGDVDITGKIDVSDNVVIGGVSALQFSYFSGGF